VNRTAARVRRLFEAVSEAEKLRLAERGPKNDNPTGRLSPVKSAGTIKSETLSGWRCR
jgi:hypothetical protein